MKFVRYRECIVQILKNYVPATHYLQGLLKLYIT